MNIRFPSSRTLNQRAQMIRPFAMALVLAALLPAVAVAAPPKPWSSKECVGIDAKCVPGLALIFDNGMEAAADLPVVGQSGNSLYATSTNGAGTLERSPTHSREGIYSLRQRLARSGTANFRQELRVRASTDNVAQANSADYWMGISVYMPSSTSLVSENTLFQWHGINKDAQNSSPIIGIRIENATWEMSREVGSRTGASLGPVATNEWTDWVVHVRWRADKTGVIEIWKNGSQVLGGPDWTNIQTGSAIDKQMPYFKFGSYSSSWKLSGSPDADGTVHESYHDSVRICYGATCTYNNVAPRGARTAAR